MELELLRERFPAHYCCAIGDVSGTNHLINTDLDLFNSLDDFHCWTPAHWAASAGKVECLRLLRSYGATNTPSFPSMTLPIHLASELGNAECVRALITQDCKINTQDYHGDTPLHKAARGGYLQVVNLLLHAGAQPDVKNFSRVTPIEVASFAAHFEVAATISTFSKEQLTEPMDYRSTHIPYTIPGGVYALCRKRQNFPGMDEVFDKRRKFTNPVFQIATDMLTPVDGVKEPTELPSSLLEHAESISMADAYASHWLSYASPLNQAANNTACSQ